METAGDRRTPQAPPFLAAACPRCGHLCEMDAGRIDATVRCPDCGALVGRRPWEVALADPVARRRFAWALVVGGGACVLAVLLRETTIVLAELGVQAYRRGVNPAEHWTAPLLVLLPQIAPLASIPAQWVLLRIAQTEARRARSIHAARTWLWLQCMFSALGMLIVALWLVGAGLDSIREFNGSFQAIDVRLARVPSLVLTALDRAMLGGVAIMLLLLCLPPVALVGRGARIGCSLIAAGVALNFAVQALLAIARALSSGIVDEMGRSVLFSPIRGALTHWIPAAAMLIGGALILHAGVRMLRER